MFAGGGRAAPVQAKKCLSGRTLPPFRHQSYSSCRPTRAPARPPDGAGKRPQPPAHLSHRQLLSIIPQHILPTGCRKNKLSHRQLLFIIPHILPTGCRKPYWGRSDFRSDTFLIKSRTDNRRIGNRRGRSDTYNQTFPKDWSLPAPGGQIGWLSSEKACFEDKWRKNCFLSSKMAYFEDKWQKNRLPSSPAPHFEDIPGGKGDYCQ